MSFDYSMFDEYAPKRYAKAIEAGQSEHIYAAPMAFEHEQSYGENLYYWLLQEGHRTMYVPPTNEQIAEWMNEWMRNGAKLGE